jgi:outer membrane protein OmpA-like peptidoglycan-associated protein
VVSAIKKKAPVVVPPPPPPVVLDKDGDGINDDKDACPDEAGLAILDGCPDKDSDGIADKNDRCPDVAGLAKYGGCPIPDTDGDGINDEQDKCVNEKGFARYQGCPIPDTDNDGVNDEEDKCPSRPGPASNMGCPEISKAVIDKINVAAKNIFFSTGSAKLLPKSFKSLDEVVGLLKADESLMINIDGHTDSTGKREKNLQLSANRADAVKTYLAGKGIAENRMTATGFGPDKPVADNKKSAGRAKNRRVEMTVRNY